MAIEIRYIGTRDKWGMWVDGKFSNYVEECMVKKIEFATKIQAKATSLAGVRDALGEIVEVYLARGYNEEGADPIKEDDLVGSGIALADLNACITMFQKLSVSTVEDKLTVNKIRNDL